MFDNIGSKIMKLAKVICWIGIIGSVILGIATIGTGISSSRYSYGSGSTGAAIFAGILTIVLGCLLSWIGSFFTYGFGQLIENTDHIRRNTEQKGTF